MNKEINISALLGKTLTQIDITRNRSGEGDSIKFFTDKGEEFRMYHYSECCESVTIDDICGDINDLLNSPILQAEESTSNTNPEELTKEDQDSFTWTFYRITTIKGQVVIRWYGESNGYYSESVNFEQICP